MDCRPFQRSESSNGYPTQRTLSFTEEVFGMRYILVLYRYSRISTDVVFSTWDPPSSTASKAVPYPKKRYEAKNRGIVSTQEWKREWNFLPS
jgi:hypothetical protein